MGHPAPPRTADPTADPRRWVSLTVVLSGAFMILLDATIVNVAIPSVQLDLGASYGSVEWVVSGYALTFGLSLIPGGRLGDRFGYRRLFVLGMLGFVTASALCGIAQTPGQLIAARVAQGVAAGLINPQIVAIIQVGFPRHERGRAFSLYGIVAGVSVAAGPLLGGLLVQADVASLLWRPIFLINVPIGVVAVLLAARLLPPTRGRGGALDGVAVVLVALALSLITVPLIEGRAAGWPAWTWLCLAAAVPVVALFVRWELRRIRNGQAVLFDLRLLRIRSLAAGAAIGLTYFTGFIGLLFMLSLHLQLGLGRSALAAGLILTAFAAGSVIGGALSDRAHARLGRGVLLLGSGLAVAGTVGVIITVALTRSGAALIPALFLVGLGNGFTIAPNVDIALESVPKRESGSVAGLVNTAQRIGNALGIAIVGVALFGALGSHAAAAAGTATDDLRRELVTAGETSEAVDAAVARFTHCYVTRAGSVDPTVAPPGCPTGEGADAFTRAAAIAEADNFSRATRVASWWAAGAVALTFLLALLAPARRRRDPGATSGVSPDSAVGAAT
ncbi:MAG TPA: MFS transporter [Actinophytocola sp.]|uniref:MFS transporter n=1 Tax=Actinophytocola sp. TaxID=1872138 RepID=UPI002DDD9DB9|nr:MFS transporter [Actinophytocola sp.]HEV2780289.1 MFS transporter [Actinophytocola sp.]